MPHSTQILRMAGVCQKCGGVDPQSIRRWQKQLGFPQPAYRIGTVPYWDEVDIDAWIDAQRESRSI